MPEIVNGQKILTIGDMSRDGLLQIMDTSWDGNGTLRVTVRELIGHDCWIGGLPLRRMRTLARRALMYPYTIKSSRVVNRFTYNGCDHVTFAVSRLKD